MGTILAGRKIFWKKWPRNFKAVKSSLVGAPTSRYPATGYHILKTRAYIHRCSRRRSSQVKLHYSLKTAPEKPLGTSISVTKRPYIRAEIEECFAERVISVFVGPRKRWYHQISPCQARREHKSGCDGLYKLWKQKVQGKYQRYPLTYTYSDSC